MDTKYLGEQIKSRWNTYGTYRLIICAWMMNEMSIVFATTEIAHSKLYVHGLVHVLSVIFIGIPLVYSEICIAQYTNCSTTTMWDFCPLLRSVGYSSIYLILLKTLYMIVLTAWYLEYSFYAALDPPPWASCDEFNSSKCMVKRVNVSVFQHCLEAENVFSADCGMKTASFFFFDREIGGHNTYTSFDCLYQWKAHVAILSISSTLFLMTLKREKYYYIQIAVKLVAVYVSIIMFVLFCVALSTSGSWFSTKMSLNWETYTFSKCFPMMTQGLLSLGTGSGMIVFLSRDVSFRSPATMTSVATSLSSVLVCLMFSLIAFSGIKNMSYYHGEEEKIIEVGFSDFFMEFASISEILSYFDSVLAFGWFSAICSCLYINFWILYLFLIETLISSNKYIRNHKTFYSFLLTVIVCFLAMPFFCVDLNGSLGDATTVIELFNNFFFAISLYWIYGHKKHSIDITFMIGVKASYFWKILWIINPIILMALIYFQFNPHDEMDDDPNSHNHSDYSYSYDINGTIMTCDYIVFYTLIAIYLSIIIFGIIFELMTFRRYDEIRNILSPMTKWGPQDKVLLKSRQLFVPQIMTTEFLYRQVRIHGYGQKNKKALKKQNVEKVLQESSIETVEWSAFTSN